MQILATKYQETYKGVTFNFIYVENSSEHQVSIFIDMLRIPTKMNPESLIDSFNPIFDIFGDTYESSRYYEENDHIVIHSKYLSQSLNGLIKKIFSSIKNFIRIFDYQHFCVGSNTYKSFNEGSYLYDGRFISYEWAQDPKNEFLRNKINDRI